MRNEDTTSTTRKPDYETDKLRAWKADKTTGKELKEKCLNITYKGLKIGLVGYKEYRNKKGKLICAYKVRTEKGDTLLYIPDNLTKREKEEMINQTLPKVKIVMDMLGLKVREKEDFLSDLIELTKHINKTEDKK